MNDSEIVKGLRSSDAADRQAALDALLPSIEAPRDPMLVYLGALLALTRHPKAGNPVALGEIAHQITVSFMHELLVGS